MTRRATFTEAELARAIRAADKAGKVALAEAGASAHQIAAWTGHESLSEVAHYTRSADRKRAVMGTNESRTVANAADPVGKLARK